MQTSRPNTAQSPKSHKREVIAWAAAVVLVGALAVYAFGGLGSTSTGSNAQTTSTTYDISASAVIQAAASQFPAGYSATSFGSLNPSYPGEEDGAYAILSQAQSDANITVLVFNTTNSSQSYYAVFASSVQGLNGYSDITSVLGGFQQYGKCYAYGEDVDGIAVANGICTDGNVFLQAHLSSTEPLQQLESDLSDIMGTMYQSVA